MARTAPPAPTLLVHANPYASLDKDGFPAGQTRHDPLAGKKGEVHFIGAEVKRTLVSDERLPPGANNKARRKRVTGMGGTDMRKPIFDFEVEHYLGPIKVADTEFHRRRLRKGEVFAADEMTARAAGLLVKGKNGPAFVPPAEALDRARKAAIVNWESLYPGRPLPPWPAFTIPSSDTAGATTTAAAAPSAQPTTTTKAPKGAGA